MDTAMNNRLNLFIAVLVAALFLGLNTLYVVSERQLAVVTQFQRLVSTQESAGLKVKMPFLQRVEYFDARLQRLDVEPEMFMTNEKKWLLVDYFVEWRIKDLRTFYTSVQGSLDRAGSLLDQLVKEGLRGEFVKYTVKETLVEGRGSIMDSIAKQLQGEALRRYGIEIVDVRLKRIDFSDDIRDACGPSASASPRACAPRARRNPRLSAPTPSGRPPKPWPRPSRRPRLCAARPTPRRPNSMPRATARIWSSTSSGGP